jgi:hypothetical protein
MKLFLPLLAVAALSACAKTPSSIPAISVASAEYAGQSCKQLANELQSVSIDLANVETKQRKKVAGDAAGVFLVLIPPSALTGDYAAEIGRYKGEKIALERAQSRANCT